MLCPKEAELLRSPKGETNQPRATPWVAATMFSEALKGRHKTSRPHCAALSGLGAVLGSVPRALPWADLFWPFRPKTKMPPSSCSVLAGFRNRGRSLPATLHFATLVCFVAVSAAPALETEADKPYQLQVVLQVSEHRMLTDVFKDRLRRELRDSLQAALGDLAKVTVVDKHPLLNEVEAKGLEALMRHLQDHSPIRRFARPLRRWAVSHLRPPARRHDRARQPGGAAKRPPTRSTSPVPRAARRQGWRVGTVEPTEGAAM